ncbi:hypothetical protein KSW27_09075 [Holdemanella biformis]|uniref:hypothetical protein n=1 Tax=Holdemanella biformis TaxID=1735 RepID=UPI001C27FB20|nr:hypothetical protein [Holdemanella biformis]MBU9896311.1 hypothetical protein [Holdemanella biformis]MBV3417423.1 hypothetical protein [Holdemanella biformis]
MFGKKMTCVLSIIGLSLVGCSNVEQPVKEEKSEVLNEIENVEESTNSYIPKQDEAQVENNNNQVYEVQQPQKEVIEVSACDDTIPYGSYISYNEANMAAQNALNESFFAQGWSNGHYGVDTHQTECGTIYYTYWFEEFVGS